MFSLDNIWDGLGGLTQVYPDVKYFFGKVTMYPNYHKESRDLILYFLKKYFPDPDQLAWPITALEQEYDAQKFELLLDGLDFTEGYKVISQFARQNNEHIPPLMNVYMHLSSTMRSFGTAINQDFGGVEETGIVVTIDDIFDEKKERHVYDIDSEWRTI